MVARKLALPRLHILVVDDDPGCRSSLAELLREDGHEVATASRGREAVHLVRGWRRELRRLELSILDYHVPDLCGLDTFALLSQELPRLGAIFISGDPRDDLEARLLAAGAFAFVRKPLDGARLRRTVGAFCDLLFDDGEDFVDSEDAGENEGENEGASESER